MKISGFTYVRNGIELDYPFLEAIQSALPIVDEMIVVIGDSTDGTREAVEAISSDKIKIIDTVWDMNMREGGKIYALQSNIGIDNITGDWAFHIQADEVIHENDIQKIKEQIIIHDKNEKIDGFVLPFYHFFGDYCYIKSPRGGHRFETRIFRNNGLIKSYRDSQGFRKYKSIESYNNGEKGIKLNVLKIDAPVYHYSYVRSPKLMTKKSNFFSRFYHSDDEILKTKLHPNEEFDYNTIGKLVDFKGGHPIYMKDFIAKKDWEFIYDPTKSKLKLKDSVLEKIAKITGIHLFEYKNYNLISSK